MIGTGTYVGGNFSASPNGLSIDATSGQVTPALSLPGIYTITYAIPAFGGCPAIPVYTQLTIIPRPEMLISDGAICTDASGHVSRTHWLDTGLSGSDYSFEWYRDGILLAENGSALEAQTAGVYWVAATSIATGCRSAAAFATVVMIQMPNDFITSLRDNFTPNATLTVFVQGGTGPYLFSIDGDAFQSQTVYTDLQPGTHTIAVTDTGGCTNLTKEIMILDYPKFFTPNNDGYNDTWNIVPLRDQPDAQIYIYDRFGKLLKHINPSGSGWDGTYNGRPVPSDDYWFAVDFREMDLSGMPVQKRFKSHFSVKR